MFWVPLRSMRVHLKNLILNSQDRKKVGGVFQNLKYLCRQLDVSKYELASAFDLTNCKMVLIMQNLDSIVTI